MGERIMGERVMRERIMSKWIEVAEPTEYGQKEREAPFDRTRRPNCVTEFLLELAIRDSTPLHPIFGEGDSRLEEDGDDGYCEKDKDHVF